MNSTSNSTITGLVIIGAGDAYWEIFDLINDINKLKYKYEIVGILDDDNKIVGKELNGIKVDGPIIEKLGQYPFEIKFVFAIGSFNNRLKRIEILDRFNMPINRYETLIHPTVKIYSNSKVGFGCILHYGCIVLAKSVIEDYSVISASCVVGVRNLIGEGALLASGITTTTDIKIGAYSFIGAGVNIAPKVEIGAGAMVGLGTNVFRSVPCGEFVFGNPCRTLRRDKVSEKILNIWTENKRKYLSYLSSSTT